MTISIPFTFKNMMINIPKNVVYEPLENACKKLDRNKGLVLEKLSSSSGWNIEKKTNIIAKDNRVKDHVSTLVNIQVGWHYNSTKTIDGVFCCIHRKNSISAYKYKGNTCEKIYIDKEKVRKSSSGNSATKVKNLFEGLMFSAWRYDMPSFKLVESKLVRFCSKSSEVKHLKKIDTIREFFKNYEHYLSPAFQAHLAVLNVEVLIPSLQDPVQPVTVLTAEKDQVSAKTTPDSTAKKKQVPTNNPPVNNQQSEEPEIKKAFYIGVAVLASFAVSGIFIKMKYFPNAHSVKV